ELLRMLPAWAPEEQKAEGWRLEDEAEHLDERASQAELEAERLLLDSLSHAPDLPEAHQALSARYRAEHMRAEVASQPAVARRSETLLQAHASALPDSDPWKARHFAYLRGEGTVSLVTDPPGAEVLLHRYELRDRRLQVQFTRSLGVTPLREVALPMGSYLLLLRAPGRAEVRYPIHVERQTPWDGVPPGEAESAPVYLPRADELGPDDCYVPCGWFGSGGDPEAPAGLDRRRLWCDAFVLQRFPVRNHQFIAFLDDLGALGRRSEAQRFRPSAADPELGPSVWLPDHPVLMVDWQSARAFTDWLSHRSGLPWRLPAEFEWEKAARGVDWRPFPWGPSLDPCWCLVGDSHPDRQAPAPVGSQPVDESPYGVRDMAGNLWDWCLDAFHPRGPQVADFRVIVPQQTVGQARYAIRGGSWRDQARQVRLAHRRSLPAGSRSAELGFRLARSLDPSRTHP
ncbi:MAG: SUMF1/EgtB/PvdO family nonheme iron enzyme, partial [Myxococcota bacterium]|nr:SUMF1/EgtB/PvdO family nonheme iron enzyme [Myxococcota bacterium]